MGDLTWDNRRGMDGSHSFFALIPDNQTGTKVLTINNTHQLENFEEKINK